MHINTADIQAARLIGVDEAGRGPLAGPVYACAVIFPEEFDYTGVNDSKKLSPKKRERFYARMLDAGLKIGIGIVEPDEIDRINILQASLKAMALAIGIIREHADFAFVDGIYIPHTDFPCEAIKGGDAIVPVIGGASIAAKVLRDRQMQRYHEMYPQYGFDRHKGYGTKQHYEAIERYGICPIHRRSFLKGIKT